MANRNTKYTIQDCQNTAEDKRGLCLGTKYINVNEKLKWQCKHKHIWYASYSTIINKNRWCRICAGHKLLTIEDCHNVAKNKGGKCLSTKYTNNYSKYLWECASGHRWNARYTNVSKNTWCPECAPNKMITIECCYELAASKNGKCLSKEYINCRTKLKWKCSCFCEWYMDYNHAKQGQWCPRCAGVVVIEIEDCHKLAMSKNGKCLSKEYTNNHISLQWECENNHRWYAGYNNVKRGTWCPKCRIWRKQSLLLDIIQKIFPSYIIHTNYKNFDWLKTKNGGKQELDIFVENIKLAVEYDGEQHFVPVCFGGISLEEATKNLKQTQLLDNIKNLKIQQNKKSVKHFVRFSCFEDLTYLYVKEKIENILNKCSDFLPQLSQY